MSGAGQAGAVPADPLVVQSAAEMCALEAFRMISRHEQRAWLRSLRRALDGQPFAENAVWFGRDCDRDELEDAAPG